MINFVILIKCLISYLRLRNQEKKVIFFSESLFYKNFYFPLFEKTKKKINGTIILTSDIKEYNFYKSKNDIKIFYIGSGFFRIIIFNYIKCNIFITTMTDIGNNLNKSINCKKYIYFFHSLASTHKIYTPKAFDNYDIIFVNGKYQETEIRKNEKIFNLKKKEIYSSGYLFLEYLENISVKSKKIENCILLAPSWNYNNKNLFNTHIIEIIDILTKNKFNVIFRPHPESIKRHKNKFNQTVDKFKNNDFFYLDNDFSNINSMEKSSILITDNSTISLEFSLIFKRPVLFINHCDKIHNNNFHLINQNTLEDIFRNDISYSIHSKDLINLPQKCKKILEDSSNFTDKVDGFKFKYLSNITNSIEMCAENIKKINSDLE